MTAFFVDLSRPRERMLICSETLGYTVADQHAPLGFCNKVIPFPHLRGALFGSGLYDIHVRSAAELMLQPELTTFAEVLAALPKILEAETERLADQRGIENPSALMLFAAGWCGWDEVERRFAMVTFSNHQGYAPERGYSGLIGIPNVPPSYVPANFTAMTPELRAVAALRAIRRFTEDHGAEFGLPPIGGEIVLTELRPDGVSAKIVARFEDYARTVDAVDATQAAIAAGGRSYLGADLVNRAENQPAALRAFEDLVRQDMAAAAAPPQSRQQRRAAARAARAA